MTGLKILDLLLIVLHFAIIGFNLLGWVWKPLRRAHFMVVCVTAACWFILGIWFGIGYCPITDWDWQVKEKLGEHHLPKQVVEEVGVALVTGGRAGIVLIVITGGCRAVAGLKAKSCRDRCRQVRFRRTLLLRAREVEAAEH